MNSPSIEEDDTLGHRIFSPEGVRLELPIAGVASRMFAYAIDFIAIILSIVILLIVLFSLFHLENSFAKHFAAAFPAATRAAREGGQAKVTPESLGGPFALLVVVFLVTQFVIEFGYFIFWEMVSNGRSPGKALAGLRVIRRDGTPIDLRSSVVRNVLRIADILPYYYSVGLVSMVLSSSGERLGDHVAGTIVVRLDRPQAAPGLEASSDGNSLTLTRDQLARIGPRELRLLRGTLRRVLQLPEDRREPLLNEVAETMRTRLEIESFPSQDAMAFLRDLLTTAERYSRNQ
jgi:uncharacterized RDD family membrane protein YckC